MGDWVTAAYEGMQARQAARTRAAEEKAAEVEAEQAGEPSREEEEAAARTARQAAEQGRAEQVAARMQETKRLRAKARPPLSAYERQMVGQALGEGVDHWDGPPAA